ncbi:MAG: hypothetical protein ACOC0P_01180, partial [Planctomycetota bacterium]
MMKKLFCMSAGLALASTAVANPVANPDVADNVKRIHVEIGPDMIGRVVDEAPVRPTEIRFIYFATEPVAAAFWTPRNADDTWDFWADDLHGDGTGPWTGGEFWMQPNVDAPVTWDFTLSLWENDVNNEILPTTDPLATVLLDDVGPLEPDSSYIISYTIADGLEVPADLWASWDAWTNFDPDTGIGTRPSGVDVGAMLVDAPNPTIGTSEDIFYQEPVGGQAGFYSFNGDPQAVFGFAIEADAASSGPCLGLEVSQLTAGLPGNFTVTGEPGDTVAILYSLQPGTYTLPDPGRLGWCLDLGLNLPRDPRS